MVVGLVGCGRLGRAHPARPTCARLQRAGCDALRRERCTGTGRWCKRRRRGRLCAEGRGRHRRRNTDEHTRRGRGSRARARRSRLRGEASLRRRCAGRPPRELGQDRLFVMDKWRYHPGVLELAAIAGRGGLARCIGLPTRRVGLGQSTTTSTRVGARTSRPGDRARDLRPAVPATAAVAQSGVGE